jgi:hypothetical protein
MLEINIAIDGKYDCYYVGSTTQEAILVFIAIFNSIHIFEIMTDTDNA